MAAPDPEHLFEQAEALAAPPPAGPPKQVSLRRAISSAYYGVFHFIVAAAADQLAGVTRRSTSEYGRVYRSIEHKNVRELCENINKQNLPARYLPHVPANGLGTDIIAFSAAFVELQEKRHAADYDPMIRVKLSDARLAIRTARAAVGRFNAASNARRKAFLSLLLFPPRRG
ncbi:MAG TPA: hypothetical protein VHY79_13710 [Rhizomicrobium sp.]|nr:hypothetical protein [Rhizomicrobium sp.]